MKYILNMNYYDMDTEIKENSSILFFINENKDLTGQINLISEKFGLEIPRNVQFLITEKKNEISFYGERFNKIIIKKINSELNGDTDWFRNYLCGTVQNYDLDHGENFYILMPGLNEVMEIAGQDYYSSSIEGILLGNYSFDFYNSGKLETQNLNINVLSEKYDRFREAHNTTQKLIDAVYFARDLVNEPANILTPDEFAVRIKNKFNYPGVETEVWDEDKIIENNLNAVMSVAKGSSNPPRFIIIKYEPENPVRHIALVGKGVTYDSGGLSIKPTRAMLKMKADMAGGAAVAGIMKAAADLQIPYKITGVIPAVENMISGNCFKPGDIIKSSKGKTIHIEDTDAEGRLILADALEYASDLKPDEIIDFATLTGAAAVALGVFTGAVMSSNDEFAQAIVESGKRTNERAWQLPFYKEFKDEMKGDISDVKNLGSRWGGAISAGKFLEFFVDENIKWAHLDIAGPALDSDFRNYTKKFATGYGVRLIFDYLINSMNKRT